MAVLKELGSSQEYVQSKAHAKYLGKQANSKSGKSNPLTDEGQPHRAGVDETGAVVPGGGKADPPPAPNDAAKILMRSSAAGIKYKDLPEKSPTTNAARARTHHAKMKGVRPPGKDRVMAPASSPPGAAALRRKEREKARRETRLTMASKEYLSKSINEQFNDELNEALGL